MAEEAALFDLPPAFVKRDKVRGHITLAANPFGQCDGAFVDLGSELHWWASTALHLDPTGARLLGEYLIAWADRKDARAATNSTPASSERLAGVGTPHPGRTMA